MNYFYNNHRKLNVWKEAILLAKIVYEVQRAFPKHETYGLCDQLRRAVVSVSTNIAEGNSRQSVNDRKRFFNIAFSSLSEVDSLIALSVELGYTVLDGEEIIKKQCELVSKMLSGLV